MINLIPDNLRANNRYAARNTQLIRYTAVAILTMVSIMVITGLCVLGMRHTENNLQKQADGQKQKLAAYKPIQEQGQQLSEQITTINTLLSRQVAFSELLPQIAKMLPPGAILRQLDVSTSDILPASSSVAAGSTSISSAQKPFVIQAAVTDRNVAATLLENIRASKDLFTDADIVNINQSTTGTSPDANSLTTITARYPYQVTINAYLKKLDPKQVAAPIGSKP
jgi:Tfp pilus assembly protein PilN